MDGDHEAPRSCHEAPWADEMDYNGGICGLGHRVVEDVMKPTMKKKRVLVVNV
jgi:hypothetical protein